jgi:O-antigen ligase/tetratricopeptide (TPR) repeat protein
MPFIVFIVPGNMFFPYITGKNFLFRIAVEVLVALWLALLVIDKNVRPKISPLLYAVTATILVLIISTLFGANPYRSFWSNYERMEGLIGHLHLFAYFILLISVLKREIEWRWFWYANAAVFSIMTFYGWMQSLGVARISTQSGWRVDGSFGNAAYMAVFMLFNVFLMAYLFLSEKRPSLKIIFGILSVLAVPVLFFTATRGTMLGFVIGATFFAAVYAFWGNFLQRRVAVGILIGLIVLVGSFWYLKDTEFGKHNYIFERFQDISFKERTVESRLTIWKMSFEGFKERPIFGWGIENYNQVFNKYFNPVLWKQEPWFDRSHNVVFDWLIAGGLAGLLAYFGIFATAVYMLWKRANIGAASSEGLNRATVFTALFGAYFVHNLFVFDNLISYLWFFTALGYIHFIYAGSAEENDRKKISLNAGETFMETIYPLMASGIFLGLVASVYFFNIKPILANYALLDALQNISAQGGNVKVIIADFEKVFSYNTFGSGEAREQLAGYASNIARSNIASQDKAQVLIFTARELEKQVAQNPNDPRGYIFLSTIYNTLGKNNEALALVNKALELSPNKQQIYFLLADEYEALGDSKRAIQTMHKAYELDTTYDEAAIGLTVTQIIGGEQKEAEVFLTEHFGTIVIADQKLINAYARVGRYDRVRDIWLKFIENDPQNFQHRVNLAATYLKLGDRVASVVALTEAIKINPQFQKQGDYYISEIKAGRNP